jgi:hypothetical protein
MADLRDIPEIYPHEVTLKLKDLDHRYPVSLAAVKWLEAHGIMNIVDFHLEMNHSIEKIAVLFKKKKHAKTFKEVKKEIRDGISTN